MESIKIEGIDVYLVDGQAPDFKPHSDGYYAIYKTSNMVPSWRRNLKDIVIGGYDNIYHAIIAWNKIAQVFEKSQIESINA